MLKLKQIRQFFPENEQLAPRNMLREYLQYKMLSKIFASQYGAILSFIGGTAIRIIHGSDRFSEDLGFDHFGLSQDDFRGLAEKIGREFEKEGFTTELKFKFDGAYRCYFKFLGLLHRYNLSGHRQEELLIQLDATRQKYPITPQLAIINKFGVFVEARANPPQILLAQKIGAVLGRERLMGRDLYDIVYLSSLTQPDFEYLEKNWGISSWQDAREAILERLKNYDLADLSEDLLPFVGNEEKLQVVRRFDRWLASQT